VDLPIENGLKMVIFHSYVSLPEGISMALRLLSWLSWYVKDVPSKKKHRTEQFERLSSGDQK